ncbi:SDR family NAD(P)-dependent oxidoreductase [Paenibacillus sedimenti]|uniref:SDR family oxidoreductase n=1 Tax=Paenibacillus sedimenti TaxID=2770274 RepID=A0A926QI14_9BACL|nr:SDR family oxidoreductase [Paenibacillus sedimenti]MBD0380050.1 SDR family oxidoreductase [Paenibacillus sedimenti]
MRDLNGKTAIITGAGSGLGKATAIAFAKEGAQVVICGRRLHKLLEVHQEILSFGGKSIAVKTDVSLEADVQHLVAEAMQSYGRIDILVNNAAVFEAGQTKETSLESWNYHIANNLTGAFLLIRECLPIFETNNYGRIINITSGLAVNGAGGFAAYSASKAGLESITRTVADEANQKDILCNMFNPGTIRTEMHATGRDPILVTPDLVKLASLPAHSLNGTLVEAGSL